MKLTAPLALSLAAILATCLSQPSNAQAQNKPGVIITSPAGVPGGQLPVVPGGLANIPVQQPNLDPLINQPAVPNWNPGQPQPNQPVWNPIQPQPVWIPNQPQPQPVWNPNQPQPVWNPQPQPVWNPNQPPPVLNPQPQPVWNPNQPQPVWNPQPQPQPVWNPKVHEQKQYKWHYDRNGNLVMHDKTEQTQASALDPNRHIVDPGSMRQSSSVKYENGFEIKTTVFRWTSYGRPHDRTETTRRRLGQKSTTTKVNNRFEKTFNPAN